MVEKLRSNWKRMLKWVGIALIYVVPLVAVQAAFDMFLKIDGVPGESADAKHKGEIDVLSWSWGASNPVVGRGVGGGGAGKVAFQDLTITKYIDKASPALYLACCQGNHYNTATLTVRKTGLNQQEYLVYKLSDIIISSVAPAGAQSDAKQAEKITFNFGKIRWTYTPQKADGSSDTPVQGGWDVISNVKQ